MKKFTSLLRILVLLSIINTPIFQESLAQPSGLSSGLTYYSNVQVFRLNSLTVMSKKKWFNVLYRFPEFNTGRITLLEGFSPTLILKMNYNIHEENIEFINEKGDTSVLEKSNQIKSVIIGDKLFYNNYPSGYIEKINQTAVALGAKHLLKMMFESNNGEVYNATDWHLPTSKFDRLYIKKDDYYFIDKNETLHKATLPAILKLYYPIKEKVKKYMKENKVDFKVKNDLIHLLEYCNQFESAT